MIRKFICALSLFFLGSFAQASDLFEAAARGEWLTLKNAVKTAEQANQKNSAGETLLIRAASSGDLKTLKYLISVGADLNAKDNEGGTALFYALSSGEESLALTLLKNKKINLDVLYGDKQENILFEAARSGSVKALRQIAAKKPKLVNQTNLDGEHALFQAVRSARSDSAQTLLQLGAKKNLKNKSGKRPVDLIDPQVDKKLAKVLGK